MPLPKPSASIRKRLLVMPAIVVAGLLVMVGLQVWATQSIRSSLSEFVAAQDEKAYATDAFGALQQIHVSLLEAWGSPDPVKRDQSVRIVRSNLDFLARGFGSTLGEPALQARFEAVKSALAQRIDVLAGLLAAADPGEQQQYIAEVRAAGADLATFVGERMEAANRRMATSKANIEAATTRVSSISMIVAVLVGVAVLTALVVLARGIAGPLKRLHDHMTVMADGRFDAPVPHRDDADEIGAMARALDHFQQDLLAAADQRRVHEEEVRARMERQVRLEEVMHAFEAQSHSLLSNVLDGLSRFRTAAEDLSRQAHTASARSQTVVSGAAESEEAMAVVVSSVDELSELTKLVSQSISQSASLSDTAAQSARSTMATVERLSAASDRIGAVIELIRSIAEQTNLLALNATIEAARAGEAGRGFSIVAQEVKQLAGQTSSATGEIEAQVRAVQDETRKAVDEIRGIATCIRDVEALSGEIRQATDAQTMTVGEVDASVRTASQFSRSAGEASRTISDAVQQTGHSIETLTAVADQLSTETNALAKRVRDFLAHARAA